MGFTIGSFNMYKWGNGNNKKDLEKLADIIKSEKFDVVAMQEVLDPIAVKNLVTMHLIGWKYSWDSPRSYSHNASEGYAFIWNPKRMKPVVTEVNGKKREFEPRILNQYKVNTKSGQTKLIRNPYFGRFTPNGCIGGCFAEFRLINTHINFGKKDDDSDEFGAVVQRNKEYEILSKTIYPKYSDDRYGNNMPAYTIILGDYNLCLHESGCGSYLSSTNEHIEIVDGNRKKEIITVQSKKTTISGSKDPDVIYANNYDHFSYDKLIFEHKPKISCPDLVKRKAFGGSKEMYKKEISDHLPISMKITLR